MLITNFINFIKKVDPNFTPNVILDIGSRDLDQSIEFSTVYPEAKIYAFEPNPAQFSICEQKSKAYSQINVFQKAISENNGTLDFYVTHGNVGASSLLEPISVPFGTTQAFSKIQVESIRLKDWLYENKITEVDVLWIDAQGLELSVLKSLEETIQKVKFIHCEAAERPYYKGHLLKNEVDEFLKQQNFSLTFLKEHYHPYDEGDIMASNESYFSSR
jgi:FkbM family methyltransferase